MTAARTETASRAKYRERILHLRRNRLALDQGPFIYGIPESGKLQDIYLGPRALVSGGPTVGSQTRLIEENGFEEVALRQSDW